MTAFDTNLTSFDKTKHNHLKFSDFNKSGANMKIHAGGCGTLISHTHWNPDDGLNATVHVATPPVAANSRGQRLQISFAALRSSSLHRSDRQFFLNLSSCINKTISTFQPWNCPFHSVLILPTKHVTCMEKFSTWHIPIAGRGSWRQPRSIMQQQNRRRRRQSWIQRSVRIDPFWNGIVWYKRAWEQNSNDTRWNDINWYGHVMCKFEWRPRV